MFGKILRIVRSQIERPLHLVQIRLLRLRIAALCGGLQRRTQRTRLFQSQFGQYPARQFQIRRISTRRHVPQQPLSLLQHGIRRLLLPTGQIQQSRAVSDRLRSVCRQRFQPLHNVGRRRLLFVQLRCQFGQRSPQLQLLLHLRMTLRIKVPIRNHNTQRSRFAVTAPTVQCRQSGQHLITRTQRVRHQIPMPFRSHSTALSPRHFSHLQGQRHPVLTIDRNLLLQTDQRQIIFRHRPQLQDVVRWQQQRCLLLINKAGSRNQVGLRSNLIPRTEHILKTRLSRHQMHAIRAGILNRHCGRPQATLRWLHCGALLCHRHEGNHHGVFGIQRIQSQFRRRHRLIGLNRELRQRPLQCLQMPVCTTAGNRFQLTVFRKLQQLREQFHSRAWSRCDAMPLSDGVARQNAVLHRAMFQPQIGDKA